MKIIIIDSRNKLNTKVIENNQSRLQLRTKKSFLLRNKSLYRNATSNIIAFSCYFVILTRISIQRTNLT